MMLQCFFKSNSFWFEFTLSFDVHHKNIFFCENIWSIKSPSLFLKVLSPKISSPWSKKVLWESRQNPRNMTVKEKAKSLQLYWKWIPSQIFFKDLLLFFKISKNIFFIEQLSVTASLICFSNFIIIFKNLPIYL